MTPKDLMKIVNEGKAIPIEIKEGCEELEIRYEAGMMTYIVSAYEIEKNIICFETEERDFIEYNKSIEKPVWLNRETDNYDLKWSDLNKKYNKGDYCIWEDASDIEDGFYNFKLLDDNKLELYNQYLQSKSELTYVQWLEGRLLEGR